MNLSRILQNPYFIQYTKAVYSIENGRYPFLSYIGINFSDREIKNIKFYFSFFRKLSEDELRKVLPVDDLSTFNAYYKFWQPSLTYNSLHQGATFAIKFSANKDLPVHYFHLRLPDYPRYKPQYFKCDDESLIKNVGFCNEYSSEKTFLKRYFYFDRKELIEQLADKFHITLSGFHTPVIDEVEYIETEGRCKIDLITSDQPFINAFLQQNTSSEITDYFKELCCVYDFTLYAPGTDSSGNNFSIYFADKNAVNAYIPFDGAGSLINGR